MMAWFERLSTREKGAVALALILVLILSARALVLALFGDASKERNLLAVRKAELTKMESLSREYLKLKGTGASTSTSLKPGETLYAFLDNVAGISGIRSKVSYMKPSSVKSRDGRVNLSVVEMKVVEARLYFSASLVRLAATSSSASAQLMRFHWPSPRPPTRFKGYFSRSGS